MFDYMYQSVYDVRICMGAEEAHDRNKSVKPGQGCLITCTKVCMYMNVCAYVYGC